MKIAGPAAIASDAKWYADAARQLVADGFNLRAYFSHIESPTSPVFYIGFVSLVALCQKVLGVYWLQGVLFCNVVALALTGTLIVALTLRLTRQSAAALAALILYLICLDIFNWARFVLSDTLFMGLSFSLFYSLACALLEEDKPRTVRQWIIVALLLSIAPFFRPTAVILFAPTMLCFGLWIWQRKASNQLTTKQISKWAATALGLLLMGSLVWSFWMQDLSRWPLASMSEALRLPYYARLYHEGVVVNGRPYTYLSPPQGLLEFFALSLRRLIYFFAFWSSQGYSLGHNLASALFFVPAYFLIAVAKINFWRRQSGLDKKGESVVIAIVIFTGAFAWFHAHTEVDYDWRYRLPAMPHLVLLAALGFASLRRKTFLSGMET